MNRLRHHFFHPALGLALNGDARGQAQRYAAGFRAAAKGGAHLRLHAIHSSSMRKPHWRTSTLAHTVLLSLCASAGGRSCSFAIAVLVRMSSITGSGWGCAAALDQQSDFGWPPMSRPCERPAQTRLSGSRHPPFQPPLQPVGIDEEDIPVKRHPRPRRDDGGRSRHAFVYTSFAPRIHAGYV